ncbi:sulfatase [Halobacteriales archaeon QS_8_69_26]|nr:MAG: sulfatase [Halobacteriales archaeon QS_8_69_26]
MAERPNVVWLTVDSVRADRTTVGGHVRDTTPNLERIADDDRGTNFSACFAPGIWSPATTASVLTGTYPSHHGLGGRNEVLPPELTTVPELLSAEGYRTAGVSANPWFNGSTGLDRGFDRFEHLTKENIWSVGLGTLLRFFLGARRYSAGYTTDTSIHRTEFLVNGLAKRWLQSFEESEEPFFLYLHTKGAHNPYYPPDEHVDAFVDELETTGAEARQVALEVQDNALEGIAEGLDTEREAERYHTYRLVYDSLLRHVDAHVGDLFEYVQSLDLGNTVFVVTSDHGDLLGERGLLSHRLAVCDPLIHVPMVVHGLDTNLAADPDDVIGHVDLMQTLLNVAGANTDGFQGVDLRSETRGFAIAQRSREYGQKSIDRIRDRNPDFDVSEYHTGAVTALRTQEYLYSRSDDLQRLVRIPGVGENVVENNPEVAEELRTLLEETVDSFADPVHSSRDAERSDAVEEQLSDLGYV